MPLLFVFDMDQVIYDYDWRTRMDRLSELTGISFAELRERWWNAGGEGRAEAGVWTTGAEYLAAANAALGTDVSADDWVGIRADATTPRADVIAAVERAAELGDVSLLTNNGALIGERLDEVAPELAPLFGDHLRASAYYGARKPDPAVFLNLMAEYGVAAEDVFFADDLPENVAGAASVGIAAHLFQDAAGLRAAIEDFAARRSAAA